MTEAKLNQLNAIFRVELQGLPYSWQWSESPALSIGVQKTHDDGSLAYDWVADPETGILNPRPIFVRHRLVDLRERWILCVLSERKTVAEWLRSMSTEMEFPTGGQWLPVYAPGKDKDGNPIAVCAALDPGEVPTADLTRKVVARIRKTLLELREQVERAKDKDQIAEKRICSLGRELILERLPAFADLTGTRQKKNWAVVPGLRDAAEQKGSLVTL